MSDKTMKRLALLERLTDHVSGMYPGDYYESAPRQYDKMINAGLAEMYYPHNPVHSDRVIITDAGRKKLADRPIPGGCKERDMGIETKTVRIVTCDYCGNTCGENDHRIDFAINSGDGRDVGPTRIQGRITLHQPYGRTDGILCNACLRKFLRMFLGPTPPTT